MVKTSASWADSPRFKSWLRKLFQNLHLNFLLIEEHVWKFHALLWPKWETSIWGFGYDNFQFVVLEEINCDPLMQQNGNYHSWNPQMVIITAPIKGFLPKIKGGNCHIPISQKKLFWINLWMIVNTDLQYLVISFSFKTKRKAFIGHLYWKKIHICLK